MEKCNWYAELRRKIVVVEKIVREDNPLHFLFELGRLGPLKVLVPAAQIILAVATTRASWSTQSTCSSSSDNPCRCNRPDRVPGPPRAVCSNGSARTSRRTRFFRASRAPYPLGTCRRPGHPSGGEDRSS